MFQPNIQIVIQKPVYSTNDSGNTSTTFDQSKEYFAEVKELTGGPFINGQPLWDADIKIIKRYDPGNPTKENYQILYKSNPYKISKIKSEDLRFETIYATAIKHENFEQVNIGNNV